MELLKEGKYKKISNVTKRAKKHSYVDEHALEPCLPCSNICPCETATYHENNVNLTASDFIRDKLLCAKHDKKINKVFKKEKVKHQLLCGLNFYKNLFYCEYLRATKFQAQRCEHEDKDLLVKRLDNVYQDYNSAVLSMERKEE